MSPWIIVIAIVGWILIAAALSIGACMSSARVNARLERSATDELPEYRPEVSLHPAPNLPAWGQASLQPSRAHSQRPSTARG